MDADYFLGESVSECTLHGYSARPCSLKRRRKQTHQEGHANITYSEWIKNPQHTTFHKSHIHYVAPM